MAEFQVRKDDFTRARVVDTAPPEPYDDLGAGHVRVRIERFGFTANNISYAASGDLLGYWRFFPPTAPDPEGWGLIPVWGFAQVVASECPGIPAGDRLFGYFPPATHLDLLPTKVTRQRFVDGAPHRTELPAGYNSYTRVHAEPGYDPATDNERMLLWPLHITSFCLWDALRDNDWFGAKQVVIVSASSKTSIGLAHGLDGDAEAPPAVGITSARNLDFVNGLGLYERAVTYETLTDLPASSPTVVVDMSGNSVVLGRLHTHLGDNMKHCFKVGLTHWDETEGGEGIIAERSKFFFAPTHIQKRFQDWGPDGFAERSSQFLQHTALKSRDWLKVKKLGGLPGLAAVYDDVCNGRVAADQGLVVEL